MIMLWAFSWLQVCQNLGEADQQLLLDMSARGSKSFGPRSCSSGTNRESFCLQTRHDEVAPGTWKKRSWVCQLFQSKFQVNVNLTLTKKNDDWSICKWLIVAAVPVLWPQVRLKFSASLQRSDACRELFNLASDVPPQLLLVRGTQEKSTWLMLVGMVIIFDLAKGMAVLRASGGVLLICRFLPVRWSLWIYSSKWLVVLVWLQLRHQHGALIRWFILKAGLSEMHKAQTTAFTSNKVELSERHVRLLKNPALSQRSSAAKHRADCRVPWTSSGRALFMPSRPQLCGCGSWCFVHLVRDLSLFDT